MNHRPSSAAPLSLSLSCLLSSRFHKVVFMHSHKHFYFNDFYYCAHSLLFMRPRGSEQAPSALHLCLNLLRFVSLSLILFGSLNCVLIRGTQCQAGLSTTAFYSVVYLYVLLICKLRENLGNFSSAAIIFTIILKIKLKSYLI